MNLPQSCTGKSVFILKVLIVCTGAGLRYDDLYDEMYDLDVKEALARLPESEILARNSRIKRAMDCSMKHVYLPKEMQVCI